MNICILSPVSGAAGGGTAAYIRCLGNRLALAGHRVTGIARLRVDNSRSLAYAESDAHDGKPEPLLSFSGWDCDLISPMPMLAPILGRLLPLLSRPVVNHVAERLFRTAYLGSLERKIPADTEIIHYVGTGWELLGFTACTVARRMDVRLTATPFVHPETWGDSRVDIRFYNQTDAVLVCSEYERAHLVKKGVNAAILQRTFMAPAATPEGDAARFRQRHRLGERPLVLFLARKKQYKGYHALRSAMTTVLKAVPDACLIAAGEDGELPYPTMPEGSFLDLGELKPTPLDSQHKADALAACDVYCMPSTAEAFGLVYVEAWSYGKPVVGGLAPALAELILDDVNGYRVEQREDQIANRLIRLLTDVSLRQRLGDEGRRIQREKCTWDAVTNDHMSLWNSLVQNIKGKNT